MSDFEDFDKKLQEYRKKGESPAPEDKDDMRIGLRAGAELITPIFAGGAIGYWIDKAADTKPIFLLVFLVLGVITGFMNVWRTSQGLGTSVGIAKTLMDNKKETKQDKSEDTQNGRSD